MGYAAIENPLFFKENSRMFYGDAKGKVEECIAMLETKGISKTGQAQTGGNKLETVKPIEKKPEPENMMDAATFEDLAPFLAKCTKRI